MKKTYTYRNGETVPVPVMEIPEKNSDLLKVNIPATKEDEQNGVGEGMWACATSEGLEAWKNDEEGIYFVQLLNDSMYYPPLKYGSVIPVRFIEGKRPVAFFDEIQHHYGDSKKDDVMQFLLPRAEKRL